MSPLEPSPPQPEVSVLLPVRNGERYVEAAIASIAAQTLRHIEIIVIDDGSTDATAGILQRLAASDPRMVVAHLPPTGLVGALEHARRLARAPLLARMDADDIALPERLQRQAAYLDHHPGVVAVGCHIENIDATGRSLGRARYPVSPAECRDFLSCGVPFAHPALMMRADACRAAGGYRKDFFPAEDHDLAFRMARVGDLANVDDVLFLYRRHAASVSNANALAQARASALAYVSNTRGGAALPSDLVPQGQGDIWRDIEAALPPPDRLPARAAYLRALCLNGGICHGPAHALLKSSLAELAAEASTEAEKIALVFTVTRGAFQLARTRKFAPAAALLAATTLRYPVRTAGELTRFARRKFSKNARS